MVKGYLGIESPEDDDHRVMTPEEMQAWIQQLQG